VSSGPQRSQPLIFETKDSHPAFELEKTKEFWSEVGSTKNFADPFFTERLSSYVSRESRIVEYGCGYGRVLRLLAENNYANLQGFDFAPKMIERGREEFPDLDLQLLEESGRLPIERESVDAAILSTVLCCVPDLEQEQGIIDELHRVLAPGGILYLCDFLITRTERYLARFDAYTSPEDPDYGVYRTSEGTLVRHHSLPTLLELLSDFDLLWLQQVDDRTMNGNPARTVHLIGQKIVSR
jgi:SAM-dependent methyltransferase